MNIEQLAANALNKIKTTWGLPKSGFIAGGSLANLIWEEVSGNKAVVNDIDVFLLHDIVDEKDYQIDKDNYLYQYNDANVNIFETYAGIAYHTVTKQYYSILESEKDGMFNYIKYVSNVSTPQIILDSFDINCTQVGYSIEEDRFYWTKDFINFLETKDLKVVNINTPSHTAIRIVKKKDELKANLSNYELDIIRYLLSDISGISNYKIRFQERYLELYKDYIDILSEYFWLEKDLETMNFLKLNRNKEINLWKLKGNSQPSEFTKAYIDSRATNITRYNFLFFVRNILGNELLQEIWNKLALTIEREDYFDGLENLKSDDIDLVARLLNYAPQTCINLQGVKLKEQVELVKKVLSIYKEDPLIGISILEKHNIRNLELTEDNLLLLELGVRKEIVNDTRGKVDRIMNKPEPKKLVSNTLKIEQSNDCFEITLP